MKPSVDNNLTSTSSGKEKEKKNLADCIAVVAKIKKSAAADHFASLYV